MEERKIGMQIGSGNLALATFRVIGQFSSADVIRLNDGGGSYLQMPALIHFSQDDSQSGTGRGAKLKGVKMAEQVHSPLLLLAEDKEYVRAAKTEIGLETLIARLVAELRELAGLFGDFSICTVAYPDYLSPEQLGSLKSAVRMEIPDLEDKHFVPASFAVLFDMQLHQARYNLGYHRFDFGVHRKALVVDLGENFTTASLFQISEVGQDLEARYLAKPNTVKVGGRDFDICFADYLIKMAIEEGSLKQSELTPQLRRQIQLDVEKFKRDLVEKVDSKIINTHMPPGKMNDVSVQLRLHGPAGKKIVEREITKAEYDDVIFPCIVAKDDTIPSVFKAVEAVMNASGLRPGDIDDVVLVGGMARVHIVGQVFKHAFGKTPREFAAPELSSVRGAAIYNDMVTSPAEIRL